MGLYVFGLPNSLVMVERIYCFVFLIIIKSEVWTIIHCLGLGHEWYALYVSLYSYSFEVVVNSVYHKIFSDCMGCVIYLTMLFSLLYTGLNEIQILNYWLTVAWWRHISIKILVNIASKYTLFDNTKPWYEPMWTYHQQGLVTFTWWQFYRKFLSHQSDRSFPDTIVYINFKYFAVMILK